MERDFFIVLLLSHNSQYNIGDWCLQTVAPVSVNHGLKLTNHGSIKMLPLIDFVNIYLLSIFFSIVPAIIYLFSNFFPIDFAGWKRVASPHIVYIVIH